MTSSTASTSPSSYTFKESALKLNMTTATTTTATSKRKSKRIRTTFTPEQLKVLEHEFAMQMYLVGEYREVLARSLGLSEGQVKVWFQNRRIKHRKLLQQQQQQQYQQHDHQHHQQQWNSNNFNIVAN